MTKLTVIPILFALLFCQMTFSQSSIKREILVKGQIFEQEGNQPLAYVSVGILNKSLGTLTDTLGNFNFQITHEDLADTLQISLV